VHLFRREAIERRDRLYGEALIARPVRWRWLLVFLLLSAAAASAFLLLVQHRPAVRAAGVTVAAPGGTQAVLEAAQAPAAAEAHSISLTVGSSRGRGGRTVPARILSVTRAEDGDAVVIRASIADATAIAPGTPVSATLAGRPVALLRWLSHNISAGADK
jgi:hypothetical protein